jgi:hypothetical protein
MITRIFISLSLIISFQTYAGPFDDLQKGLGAMKDLEGMMNKKEEKKDEKTIEQANEPVIEDPAVAEAKRKEAEKRKEEERLAREEKRKKDEQERIARQAEQKKRQEREEIMNYVAMIPAADRCRDEYQIDTDTKTLVKEYSRDKVSKGIEGGAVSKDWVNNNLKRWRVMVAQQSLGELYSFCQNLTSIAAAIKAETQEDEDAF